MKADKENTWKLAQIYYKEYDLFQDWKEGRVDLDKLRIKSPELKKINISTPPLNLRA
jgi:hypothetical protein